MARVWSELFITRDAAGRRRGTRERRGLLRRLRESMCKTRQALGSGDPGEPVRALDEQTWERLEEALIMADVGAATTASVVRTLEQEAAAGTLEGGEQRSASA